MGQLHKILAITGIRSEYDILYPVLQELNESGHELGVVVSGAHLSDQHGMTEQLIRHDGFKVVDRIDSLFSTDRLTQRSKGVGALIQGLTQTVDRVNPDFLLVVGDREESIATAVVGNYINTLVVHIGGGDPVHGNADDPVRFAVSKLAHLHCCMAEKYAQNLLNIGEEKFRTHWTGNPAYVNIDRMESITIERLAVMLDLPISEGKFIVLIQHPLSSEAEESIRQMDITLQSLQTFCSKHSFKVVYIAPNTDPSSYSMRKLSMEYQNFSWFHPVQALSRVHFVNLMRHTQALVGNSSMAILEAPHYRLPAVNVGNRQKGRLNAGNVEFVPHESRLIIEALEKACFDASYREGMLTLDNPYGDSNSAIKVREEIEAVDLKDDRWYTKRSLCP